MFGTHFYFTSRLPTPALLGYKGDIIKSSFQKTAGTCTLYVELELAMVAVQKCIIVLLLHDYLGPITKKPWLHTHNEFYKSSGFS